MSDHADAFTRLSAIAATLCTFLVARRDGFSGPIERVLYGAWLLCGCTAAGMSIAERLQ